MVPAQRNSVTLHSTTLTIAVCTGRSWHCRHVCLCIDPKKENEVGWLLRLVNFYYLPLAFLSHFGSLLCALCSQCCASRLRMTGKSIRGFYEAFRRNSHLVFPVREVKGDRHRGALKHQHVREKTKSERVAVRVTARELCSFSVLFTFSFRVACFSILAADSSGLCDGQSLSSHRTPATLLIRRLRVWTCSKKCVERCPPGRERRPSARELREDCSCEQKLFSRKVRHVVKSFPFFLLLLLLLLLPFFSLSLLP